MSAWGLIMYEWGHCEAAFVIATAALVFSFVALVLLARRGK